MSNKRENDLSSSEEEDIKVSTKHIAVNDKI